MSTVQSFEFNGKTHFARELTTRELDLVLGNQEAPAQKSGAGSGKKAAPTATPGHFRLFDLIFMDEPVSSQVVMISTGLTEEELDADVSPVELEKVLEAVKAANPFLVRAVRNGQKVAELNEELKRIGALLEPFSEKR